MLLKLAKRMLTETDPRLLARFAISGGLRSLQSGVRFRERLRRGRYFPAFVFISVTNRCNLRCQGCWVRSEVPRDMPPADLDRLIRQSKAQGSRFFGILGGEPLLYEGLWAVLGRHRDCYFQVFTNGVTLDAEAADAMRRLGNVTPLVSVEGLGDTADERRGSREVERRTFDGLAACRDAKLITGVATSLCASNIDELLTERFLGRLVDLGVHYLWYYIYRPVGPEPRPELALEPDQVDRLRRFVVEMRSRVPLAIIDAYWDHRGKALCPAATGISVHVNPWGDVEPCPPIQFACDRLNGDAYRCMNESRFLSAFRSYVPRQTRGCILLDHPGRLHEFARSQQARDTTGRGCGFDEVAAMCPRSSHDLPGREVPESHWFYRFAKKHWFFGFGAYA